MAEKQEKTLVKENMMGESHTRFGVIYRNMKKRCNDPNSTYYYLYGGKGIRCMWNSYDSFKKDMYESYVEHCEKYGDKNTSIDRIDSNGYYCKENCRWATVIEQGRNTCRNHRYKWKGGEYTLKEIYEMENVNIAYKTFAWRVYDRGWTIEKAIKTPFINQEHRYERKGGEYLLKEIYDMEKPPMSYGTFMSRIYQSKWSLEEAVNTPVVKGFGNKLLYANIKTNG